MIKIRSLKLNGVPRVALCLKDKLSSSVLREIKNLSPDLVEHRIDRYSSLDAEYVLNQIKKLKQFPAIATIRSRKEGGAWNSSEERRLELFEMVLPYVDAVDIELSSNKIAKEVIKAAHKNKKIGIVSYHNFSGTPTTQKLTQILKQARAIGADVVKIAAFTASHQDMQRLADFTLVNRTKNIIVIAMGDEGSLSRIFFPSLGSLITYTSLGEATAPGQLAYHETVTLLKKLYPRYK